MCVSVCVRVCCGEYSSDKGQGTGVFRRRLMMFFLTLSLTSELQSSSGFYSGRVMSVCVFNVFLFLYFACQRNTLEMFSLYINFILLHTIIHLSCFEWFCYKMCKLPPHVCSV